MDITKDITKEISTKKKIYPQIYAYTIPTYPPLEGWVKIGETKRKNAQERIDEQGQEIPFDKQTLWINPSIFKTGEYFSDHDFHAYIQKHDIERYEGKEWFNFGLNKEMQSRDLYYSFVNQNYNDVQKGLETSYILRDEQKNAVQKALEYAKDNPDSEFLWNAKPRFGKTLSAYDFARKFDAKTVLIITNRPAIANSWFDDFIKFIAWQTDYKFVSESESLRDRNTLTSKEFGKYAMDHVNKARRIEFISLQDLKGSIYHGGKFEKLEWVGNIEWDLLIIDEAHEGVDTLKTDVAFDQIKRKFTLHLSGTPFKAIAKGNFSEEQIFNWSYTDEQEAKKSWDREEKNPYEVLPKLNMFTYQMSNMITDEINKGADIDGKNHDYAFDLNEFFSTKPNGKFVYENDINKWLNTLTTNEKYPFSTPKLRNELKHTFWILERVDSAKALARLLKKHPVFENYEIVVAAGDGKLDNDMKVNEASLKRVKKAIKSHEKTITLSVGQLTTGVTIPEWTGVLMLSNMKSPAQYMQAAFRSQNPYSWQEKINDEEVFYMKENAYVFDFSPERTLIVFDHFANDLLAQTSSGGGTMNDREENIKTLLNFFPVIGEDSEGKMKELDFNDVLTIPRKIKANEVVKRGFMSNLLFANISGIFSAPQVVLDTLDKLKSEEQGKIKVNDKKMDTQEVEVNDQGETLIDEDLVVNTTTAALGDKIFRVAEKEPKEIPKDTSKKNIQKVIREVVSKKVIDEVLYETKDLIGATNKEINSTKKIINDSLEHVVESNLTQKNIDEARLEREFKEKIKATKTIDEKEKLENELIKEKEDVETQFTEKIKERIKDKVSEETEELVRKVVTKKENAKKTQVEEDVRSRLRGFARTIPSFIMAYGKDDLTLANFDTYIPPNVFQEVTGITIEQFKFLRDGGPYEENGIEKHFKGRLFDEIVFNESVQEFLKKKSELSNYFAEQEEDIFDYIPTQETNQIYTPKNVVIKMVEDLEKENPGIYDDSSKTFIDIYMKSGLYITEIVKKLFNSEQIKREFPNDEERIKHILENQVYGFAPSEIIYNIAINFIFGELDEHISRENFHHVDTVPYAKEGTMQELIDSKFGKN